MAFTNEELNEISKRVYRVDKENYNLKDQTIEGKIYDKSYKVIQTKDTKDAEENGFQGMAVVPLDKNGKPDYSQITIAFAGTGDAKKGANNYFPGVGKDSLDVQQAL